MKARVSKKILSLLLALCMVLTMLPSMAFAEEGAVVSGTLLGDSSIPPSLAIGVSGITDTGATVKFTANQDGTVYYLVQEATEAEPDVDTLCTSASVEVTAGIPAGVEVNDLLAGTDYIVYGLAVGVRSGGDLTTGSDSGSKLVSSIVSKQFTLAAPAPGKRGISKAVGALLAGAADPGTQTLNESWKTDVTNGFSEPAGSSEIYYEPNCIYLNSMVTTGEWIEFAASSSEGLEAFDLTSVTLGKYLDPSINFNFTIMGTKSGGATVSKNFSWPSSADLTKRFSGSQFDEFTQLTKFSITLQDVNTATYDIEFREFTITNRVGSGNTPPILSGFTGITFLENEVNAAFRQIAADIAVSDVDSANFNGGQITVSYTGTPLPEDQLSIGNIGMVSLLGGIVRHGSTEIGTANGGVNGASLVVALNSNATPERTSDLLRAITYRNTSNEPTSHRIFSITVSDGAGGTSTPAAAKVSVSGQAESGVEYPALFQNASADWTDNLNNGFSVLGNGGVLVGGDSTSIWVQNNTSALTASICIAAAEQFAGGMFDLSGLTFDVFRAGETYTVEIIGHKPNASTVTAAITGTSKAVLETIDLSSMKGIVAFDFQVTAATPDNVTLVGIDTFTIENPAAAGDINTVPIIANFTATTFLENDVNSAPRQIDADVTVTDADSANFDGGQVTVAYTGAPLTEDQLAIGNIGALSVSGSVVSHSGTAIGTVSGGVNGASLVVALNSDATPEKTRDLLRAITYQNTSNQPTSHRTVSITVSDGDGGVSAPATAKISVSGQAESGLEYPATAQNVSLSWIDDLNNGFSVQGNGSTTLSGDGTSIWADGRTAATASFRIAAAEQFAGGMFDLSGLTFDVFGTGKTYTVTITGHKPNGSTVTATKTGDSKTALDTIDLSGIKGIISFDFQVAAPAAIYVEYLGLDSFTVSNLGTANALPSVSGLPASITVTEDTAGNVDFSTAAFSDADGNPLAVTLTATAGTFAAVSGGGVTVGGTGTRALTLAGTAAAINTYLDTAANIRYTGALNANGIGAASIAVNASDGKVDPLLGTVSVNITAVNDDPAITGLPATITVAEYTAGNVDLSAASFSDVDAGGNDIMLTLSVDVGVLTALSGGGVTVSGASTKSLTLNGTTADIDAYLNTAPNIKYSCPPGLTGNDVATLTLVANDYGHTGAGGGTNVTLGTVSIHVTEAAPTVTMVTSYNANVYGSGAVIGIVVRFPKAVVVTGTPQLTLNSGGTAAYTSGSGTGALLFIYTVGVGDISADLDYTSAGALSLNGGGVKTMSGIDAILTLPNPGAANSLGANKDIVIDGVAPTVTSAAVPVGGLYKAGDALTFTVYFSEPVIVAAGGGVPSLPLTIGSTTRQAAYMMGSGTGSLAFRYTIQPGDLDADGVGVGAALSLNGRTIRDGAGNDAALTLHGVGSTTGILVDTISPTITGAAYVDDTHIAVTLSEPCENLTKPNHGGFIMTQTGTATAYAVLATNAGLGNTVVLTVADIGLAGASGVTVTYTKGGNGTIADAAGNRLETDSDGKNVAPWDISAPDVPSTPNLAASSDSGVSDADNITNRTTLTFTGTAEASSTVKLYFSSTQIGTATADGSGNWSITSTVLSQGRHTITATATDRAGNTSAASGVLVVKIDITAPMAVVSMGDTSLIAGGNCRVAFTFLEVVTGFTNSDLTVDNGTLTPVSSTDGGMNYTAVFTADSVNDDTNTITINLTGIADIAGNTGTGTATSANYTISVPVVPGAPTGVTATAGNRQATVRFTPPASGGGAAITRYTVTANPGGITTTGSTSPITVTGLTNGTAYTFTVAAENSAGTGASSAVSNSVTPQAPSTGGGDDEDLSSPSTPTAITPDKKPDQPVTAVASVVATTGANGSASANVSDKAITDVIAKAQSNAKEQGKTANGISVALNIAMPQGATSLTTTLTPSSLNSLVSAGVSQLKINGSLVDISFNLNALKEIQKQSGGSISITIAPATGLFTEAKALLGNRPVYNITISYVKDSKTVNVTSLGRGTATLSIPYIPGKNEAVGYLFGVYVDANGKAQRIPGSAYDANSKSMLIPTGHFSVYGVGYTAPSAKFTDIATHWGKEAIDYVVGRGLFSGTAETTFASNTAMTRGMLVTALGRLTGVDAKAYTTNSFTDVKADSTFRPYIEWAYQKGVIKGTGNGKFEPSRAVTREEIAMIFVNYAKATGYTLPVTREATTYADASSIGRIYKTAVTTMQQAGIMMGRSGNKFNPKSNATRAEVSFMLHRYIKLSIDPATAQGWALNDAGQWLYYKDGLMVSGKWLQIDGKWYYFNADGSMAKSTKVDGYEIDGNGARKIK